MGGGERERERERRPDGESAAGTQPAMATRVVLVRHGERVDHVDPSWRDTAAQPSDSPLSPAGHRQAAAAGAHLAGSRARVLAVYASPFTRTLETAAAVAAALPGAPVRREPAVAEWLNGAWFGGRFWWPPPGAPARALCAPLEDGYASVLPEEPAPPETREEVGARGREAVLGIVARHQRPEDAGGTVVIVTHGKLVEDCIIGLTGIAPDDVPYVTYCSTSVAELDDGRWVPRELVRTDFMLDGIRPDAKRKVYM